MHRYSLSWRTLRPRTTPFVVEFLAVLFAWFAMWALVGFVFSFPG